MKTNMIGRSVVRLSTAAMLAGTLVLAGCGGGSDSADDTTMMPPPPTAFEAALAAINAATTVADAQAAYDDVDKEAVTGAEAAQLMAALEARQTALRASSQQSALMTLSAAVDTSSLTTQADVDAANAAIAALQMAVDNAVDVSDADKAQYIVQLNNARDDVNRAVASIAEQGRVAVQTAALMDAADAVDTSNLTTETAIAAANLAIAGLQAALDAAVDVSAADKATYVTLLGNARNAVTTAQNSLDTMGRQASQRMTINGAVEDATTKVRAVNNDSSDADVAAAETAIATLKTAIADAVDLVGHPEVTVANGLLAGLESELKAATESRQMAMNDADRKAREAMAVTAAKLYADISAPMGDPASPAATDRAAAYNTAETAIMVSIGDGTNVPTAVSLSEDKKATVAANHGWAGKRYTRTSPASEGMYEAVVYSNVEAPTQGRKFGNAEPGTGNNREFEYGLTNGMYTVDGTVATNAPLVGGSGFDHTAGVKSFSLPSPNPSGVTRVSVPGSFHGVSGTYTCTPGADTCAAQKAASGFTLGLISGGTFSGNATAWTFRPSDPNARVTSGEDDEYASYGWWLHKSENDATYTASAFVDEKGAVPAATDLNALNGTATYQGGAAGKYALSSSTGGTNDAGHFTARATLEANFTTNDGTDTTTNAITGTIDNFIGADGESRDWQVELKGSPIADTGGIGAAGGSAAAETVWTIGGDAADAGGAWTGTLRNNGTDGVPRVATGTFDSTYDQGGKMVGAFGATKQ